VQDQAPAANSLLEQLHAQTACQDLIYRFVFNIDSGEATKNVDLFTESAEMGLANVFLRGHGQIATAMAAREADVARKTRHQITNIVFERTDADCARARSLLFLYVLGGDEELSAHAITTFDDEFRRGADGQWLFSRRNATILAGSR